MKRRGAVAAAETVGLPANRFHKRDLSRYEGVTDGVLDHLIRVSDSSSIEVALFEFADRPAEKKIEDDKEAYDEQKSIHSGLYDEEPQSYETTRNLSSQRLA